jgi:hypothetical protein
MSESKGGCLTELVAFFVILYFVGATFRDVWYSKTVYALRYSTDGSRVLKEPRPVDCDFLGAPIGDKGCHYTPEVSTQTYIVRDNGYGRMFWSDDDGKTWNENDKGLVTAGTGVYVSWKKITE